MDVKRNRKKWAAAFWLILVLAAAIPVQAADNGNDVNQIIFLLDSSNSMSGERWQEALDSVLMITSMLPSDYQTALLIYNEAIDTFVDFDQSITEQITQLRETKQRGYTNTGEALEAALAMFDPETAGEKRVVVISDGEIIMRTREETEEALKRYDSAAAQALANSVSIDILLFETEGIEEQITSGANLTDGYIFRRTKYNTAENFAKKYIFDLLNLERIMLGTSDSLDSLSDISLKDTYADRARILLTAGSRIEDIKVSCQSREIQIIQGGRFAVIILEQPMEETVNLQYTLAQKGRINAYLVKEYSLAVSAEAAFEPDSVRQRIQVGIVNSDGKNVLEDEDVRQAINIFIDNEKVQYEVLQGNAIITYPAETSREITLYVDLNDLNSIVYCEGAKTGLWLQVPPKEPEEIPEEEPDFFWMAALILAGFLALAVILALVLYLRRPKPLPAPKEERPEPGKYSYVGRIHLYITRTRSGYDIPPLSYNLLRLPSGKVISLQEILAECELEERFPGAENIYFKAGPARSLILTNNSDCTLIRSREILMKKKSYSLAANAKVDVSFEDEISELTLQYRV